jgi:hypothetical protein
MDETRQATHAKREFFSAGMHVSIHIFRIPASAP